VGVVAQVEPLTRARGVRGPFDYLLTEEQESATTVGSVLLIPFGRRSVLGVVTGLAEESELPLDKLATPEKVFDIAIPPELVELARWTAANYCTALARSLSLVLPPGVGLSGKTRKVLRTEPRKGKAVSWSSDFKQSSKPINLNSDQQAAVATVVGKIESRKYSSLLLNGVTGSGKTEVYLAATKAAIKADRTAIILVPEIALTPQTVARFEARFGDTVAVLHSALTVAERYDQWLRLWNGSAKICIGPRSALFAPLKEVGLIVIDEEHDGSYKSDSDPRYDARVVAQERAKQAGAVLLLGTATPRPESYYRSDILELPQRVDGAELPKVETLDSAAISGALHTESLLALERVRERAEKAVVLLNRRGWSNFLSCQSCGHVWQCPNCDVTLVLHKASSSICCHHCGWRQPQPHSCDQCGSVSVARHGAGTEQVEQQLYQQIATKDFPVFRLDSDVGKDRKELLNLISRFAKAKTGVLIGTQMIAKGHDFPDVTLGIVVDADQTLRFPDFRAEERTFQLVAQLAGRAGRGHKAGRVIVQAADPKVEALQYAAKHDSVGFLEAELKRRKVLQYPPYADTVRVVTAAEEYESARKIAEEIKTQTALSGDTTVLGPAALFKLRGKERSHLFIKTQNRTAALKALAKAVDSVVAEASKLRVAISVDVDPQ